ncbi:hypothetical protein T281_10445 [Rhodomicrobium udaipurense JA643]|uniref:Uncharacterized protein n=1 Tax=Rhodomicrobium udaipurense TaxID=1202716 RepID=A0A8I1G7V9_9HYPH|nr:hypothetical protein [Rhodomicrobium udaipurense]KAI94530.1 hypothetical protein T281_10445 [Rhodomicrobium udaipurense JA643]MBJ7542192.1 hypothetical protein [Rhodomicrobium udaipurense]
MKKILLISALLTVAGIAEANAQASGSFYGGAVNRNSVSGASGAGHAAGAGFGLLASRGCWADANVGCNATPMAGYQEEPATPAVSTEDPPAAAPAAEAKPAKKAAK